MRKQKKKVFHSMQTTLEKCDELVLTNIAKFLDPVSTHAMRIAVNKTHNLTTQHKSLLTLIGFVQECNVEAFAWLDGNVKSCAHHIASALLGRLDIIKWTHTFRMKKRLADRIRRNILWSYFFHDIRHDTQLFQRCEQNMTWYYQYLQTIYPQVHMT